jgi:hypothetical protein
MKTDTCCPNTKIKYNTGISIASAPLPILSSRDDESSMNDDEYEVVKNATDIPTQCSKLFVLINSTNIYIPSNKFVLNGPISMEVRCNTFPLS